MEINRGQISEIVKYLQNYIYTLEGYVVKGPDYWQVKDMIYQLEQILDSEH